MLEGLQPHKRKYPCRIRSILDELNESDQKILIAALEDENAWSAKGLANQLKEVAGITSSDGAIVKHRRKLCSCGAN